MQVFMFFKVIKEIDWEKNILTIFGPITIDSFNEKMKNDSNDSFWFLDKETKEKKSYIYIFFLHHDYPVLFIT